MKTRYAYPLLFLVPIALAAALAAVLIAGAGAGIMWMFIYGDDVWPSSANMTIMVVAVTVCILVFSSLVALCYSVGKAYETRGGLRRAQVLTAIGLSVGLPLLVLWHQWQVGNLSHRQSHPVSAPHESSVIPGKSE